MRVRKRKTDLEGPFHYDNQWTQNFLANPIVWHSRPGVLSPINVVQTTVDDSHDWPIKDKRAGDVGGDFTSVNVDWYRNHTPQVFTTVQRSGERYIGPAWPEFTQYTIDKLIADYPLVADSVLHQKGSTAISKCIPTNPVSDAATFVGELKAGLPKMVGSSLAKSKFKDYRKIGDEYLNVEFGWKPIISDVQKFGKAAIESDKIIKQLHRDSGKLVRRKFEFPMETEVKVYSPNNNANTYCYIPRDLWPAGLWQSAGRLQYTDSIETRTWFSGAFTYHLNLGTRLQDKLDRHSAEASKLFGTRITPAVLWNLAPWSWAVDWEGNIGDVLHNVSQFSNDGLVMPYGYIMQQKTVVRTVLLTGGCLNTSTNDVKSLSVSARLVTKKRLRATPFGFGFDMTALTGRQSAIIAALGISRGPRG